VKEIPGVPIAVSQCSSIHSAPADGTMTDPNPLRIRARNFERGPGQHVDTDRCVI
jgi:hypothetical protein